MSPRVTSLRSQLVRLGFQDADRSAASIESLGEAARKAKRDARYAARKARVGRAPPGFSAR